MGMGSPQLPCGNIWFSCVVFQQGTMGFQQGTIGFQQGTMGFQQGLMVFQQGSTGKSAQQGNVTGNCNREI